MRLALMTALFDKVRDPVYNQFCEGTTLAVNYLPSILVDLIDKEIKYPINYLCRQSQLLEET